MTKRNRVPLAILATSILVVVCGIVIADVGPVLYQDNDTGQSYPEETRAGYLATADGGVVTVLNSPAPTALGQTWRSTTTGRNATMAIQSDPAATTTAAGVVRLDPNDPLPDGIASPGSGGMCADGRHVHPAADVVGGTYWINTNGQENEIVLREPPTDPNDLLSVTITSGSSKAAGTFWGSEMTTNPGTPNIALWPAGYLKAKLFVKTSAASATIHLDYGRRTWPGHVLTLLAAAETVATVTSTSLQEIDASYPVDALDGDPTDVIYLLVWATTTSGSSITVALANNTSYQSRINTPLVAQQDLSGYQLMSQLGQANGYAPLDPNALVPVGNLPAAAIDSFTIKAAAGTTAGYLSAVCESATSSIVVGQTGNYVTFDANFGSGHGYVCQGDDARLSDDRVASGLRFNNSGVAYTLNTNPPLTGQIAYAVDPAQESAVGTNTSTNTTTAAQIKFRNPPVSIPLGTSAIVSVTTSTATALSTATNSMPSDAKVRLSDIPGRLLSRTVLTATGTATSTSRVYTPTAGTTKEIIEYVAGGGGGGGCGQLGSNTSCVGGGGAAGEYASVLITSVPASWNYYCGPLGVGGSTSGTTGEAGRDTVVVISGTTYTAKAGFGGEGCTTGFTQVLEAGGNGDAHSTGGDPDYSFAGMAGGIGFVAAYQVQWSGFGGSGPLGSGGGPITSTTSTAGRNGSGNGSGGGGCSNNGAGHQRVGGDGTSGVIIVWDF